MVFACSTQHLHEGFYTYLFMAKSLSQKSNKGPAKRKLAKLLTVSRFVHV